jgi:hypothetical protein
MHAFGNRSHCFNLIFKGVMAWWGIPVIPALKRQSRDDREWWLGVNLTKVQCKHIWKCHKETPVQLIYANKNIKRERESRNIMSLRPAGLHSKTMFQKKEREKKKKTWNLLPCNANPIVDDHPPNWDSLVQASSIFGLSVHD